MGGREELERDWDAGAIELLTQHFAGNPMNLAAAIIKYKMMGELEESQEAPYAARFRRTTPSDVVSHWVIEAGTRVLPYATSCRDMLALPLLDQEGHTYGQVKLQFDGTKDGGGNYRNPVGLFTDKFFVGRPAERHGVRFLGLDEAKDSLETRLGEKVTPIDPTLLYIQAYSNLRQVTGEDPAHPTMLIAGSEWVSEPWPLIIPSTAEGRVLSQLLGDLDRAIREVTIQNDDTPII